MNPLDRIPSDTNPFDGIRRVDDDGSEWWSARDLMPLLGYDKWERFSEAIERARIAALNSGQDPDVQASRLREAFGRTGQVGANYRLTRFGAYLTAMNGDPRKEEIAKAQAYFAVKTREAEVAQSVAAEPDELEIAERYVAALKRSRALEARNAELEPAAKAWTVLASGDGDYSVADAAKILSRDPNIKLGRDRLFTLLREYGWLYRQQGDTRHRAYQTAVDTGRLSELPSSHYHPRTGVLVLDPPQVRVTLKGLQELHKRLGGVSPLDLFGPPGGAA